VKIELQNIGKKYHRDWIFKNLSQIIEEQAVVALHGGNGSGKSTLLKILSGYLTPTEGLIAWYQNGNPIPLSQLHNSISLCAPYQMPFPEFTLRENVDFYRSFKPLRNGLSTEAFADVIQLSQALDKPLHNFSSGMQQRLKLGLAVLSDAPLLLLDEPTSHLDKAGQKWYHELLLGHIHQRTVVIATNEPEKDVPLQALIIGVSDYKHF
jgi:heme exporter protein A